MATQLTVSSRINKIESSNYIIELDGLPFCRIFEGKIQSSRLQHADTVSLVAIVPVCSPVLETVIDQGIHILKAGTIVEIEPEAIAKSLNCIIWSATKTRQIFVSLL